MSIFLKKEVFFVKFPILFPLIYLTFLYTFPSFENYLIFLTILILAETHFGATWPFFLDKVNFPYIKQKKIELIIIPILLIIFCIIGFFYFKSFFLLIFFAANMYHVTRQSYGIVSLYTKEPLEKAHYSNIIYLFNLLFFFIAFFRFYMSIINDDSLLILNFAIIFMILFVFWFEFKKFGFSENFLTLVTGVLIFYPVCFVTNPVHAIIMGVSMHYSQYLYLTSKVIKKRNDINDLKKKSKIFSFLFIIIIYSLIMSILSILGKNDSELLKSMIFIPITGQMLHFYLDSQLWKFSEQHNRENILKYL